MECIQEELVKFPEEDRDDVVILFSAHSLPLTVSLLDYLGKPFPYSIDILI